MEFNFKQKIQFPPSLTELYFPCYYVNGGPLPSSLLSLSCRKDLIMDPVIIIPSLTSLEITGAWPYPPLSIDFSSFTNLKSLKIQASYSLPLTLQSLRHNFDTEIFNLPHLSLHLATAFSSFSFNSLPPSLSQITFNHNIDSLPSSLTYIKLGYQPISSLPPSQTTYFWIFIRSTSSSSSFILISSSL